MARKQKDMLQKKGTRRLRCLTVKLPAAAHRRLRVRCVKREITLQTYLRELLRRDGIE